MKSQVNKTRDCLDKTQFFVGDNKTRVKHRMPSKKPVPKLEDLSLQILPNFLKLIAENLLVKVRFLFNAGVSKKDINYQIEEFIEDYQEKIFFSVPSHFHKQIIRYKHR